MTGKCPVPPKRDRRGPCLPAGRKGHDQSEISLPRSDAPWAGSFISGETGNKRKEISGRLFMGLGFFLHLHEK
jgi:hypothetical protein